MFYFLKVVGCFEKDDFLFFLFLQFYPNFFEIEIVVVGCTVLFFDSAGLTTSKRNKKIQNKNFHKLELLCVYIFVEQEEDEGTVAKGIYVRIMGFKI